MDRQTFARTARENALTIKQLIKLTMIKSEIYHAQRYKALDGNPNASIDVGDILSNATKMRPIRRLHELGMIALDDTIGAVSVTATGWAIAGNCGAAIFLGGCDDADITDFPNAATPTMWFGPVEDTEESLKGVVA